MSACTAPTNIIEFACGFTISGNLKDVDSKKKRHYRHCKICIIKGAKIEPIMDTVCGHSKYDVKYHKARAKNHPAKVLSAFEDELCTTSTHPNSTYYKKKHMTIAVLNMIIKYMKEESMLCYTFFKMHTPSMLEKMDMKELLMISFAVTSFVKTIPKRFVLEDLNIDEFKHILPQPTSNQQPTTLER